MSRREIGERGEKIAAEWLAGRGFLIERRNYRCRIGELDLIVRRGRLLVFVEVRTRSPRGWVDPVETIDARKKRRMTGAALAYLKRFGSRPPACRFDVIAVRPRRGEWEVRHIPDAFRPGW